MKSFGFVLLLAFSFNTFAGQIASDKDMAIGAAIDYNAPNFLDSEEFDPNDPNAEAILEAYDRYYQEVTGIDPHLEGYGELFTPIGGCYRQSCAVWAHVNKATQRMKLYIDGTLVDTFKTSTGTGNRTPNFDKNPDGRIYTAYTSRKFPGGDYNGLGNMPYAVFIRGGFAIHGTPRSNWKYLGSKASHGCIRIHPDNARWFNSLVRQAGVRNTWITVD